MAFGQFRHQYFPVFVIAHVQKAGLLVLSDRLIVALSRLNIQRIAIMAVLVTALLFYTLGKSKTLADFLDAVLDTRLPLRANFRAFLDVWTGDEAFGYCLPASITPDPPARA